MTRNRVRIAVDRCFSAVRLFRKCHAINVRGYLSNVVNGCQGTPWSEELDDKELYGVLDDVCDLEPRRSAVSRTS